MKPGVPSDSTEYSPVQLCRYSGSSGRIWHNGRLQAFLCQHHYPQSPKRTGRNAFLDIISFFFYFFAGQGRKSTGGSLSVDSVSMNLAKDTPKIFRKPSRVKQAVFPSFLPAPSSITTIYTVSCWI